LFQFGTLRFYDTLCVSTAVLPLGSWLNDEIPVGKRILGLLDVIIAASYRANS
jgi:hypothetical protein